ncbi:MAG: WYL domain-containing protein, partial [Micrococcus sp.]|nr:WYL domain-containing protein [Micrococcus sp.]
MVAEHSRATSEPVERIISVLWLLFRHPEGLTRDQLKRLIVGYEDLSAELFDKRWRWDRDALAEVGVEVIEDRGEGGLRYRVDAEHLVLPELDFTPAEHHALLLARELLDDDRLRRDAHAAVALLTPAGAQVDPDRLARLPRTPPRSVPGLREFTRAAVEQSTVSFGYRDAHAHSSRRTVRVWAVFQSRGQWYVHGWDLDRSARRTFRLSRIAGAPVPSPRTGAPERPADVDPAALRAQAAPEGTVPALTVHLAPGRAQAVRARSHRRGGDPHHLPGAWSEDAAKTAPAWERWELPQTPLSEALELLGSCLGSALPSAEHPDVHAALAEHWQRALDAHRGDPTANDRAALRGLAAPKRTRRRLSTVDHVSRLLDIVGLANRTGGITRAELRDRFDLSESELDRDLALLPYCGMPERFYAGDQFDVHDDGTTVRITGAGELYGPLRLTRPEAQRLEAALQLLGQVPSVAAADRAAAATARQRLNTALGVAESHGESPRHAES